MGLPFFVLVFLFFAPPPTGRKVTKNSYKEQKRSQELTELALAIASRGSGCTNGTVFLFFRDVERERERKRERETKAPGFSGAPPISSTTQFPIQTGVSAPAAAVGNKARPFCGPLLA